MQEMNLGIQKDIESLAQKCLRAGVNPQVACNVLVQTMQNEWQRTLIEAPGLVRAEKKE